MQGGRPLAFFGWRRSAYLSNEAQPGRERSISTSAWDTVSRSLSALHGFRRRRGRYPQSADFASWTSPFAADRLDRDRRGNGLNLNAGMGVGGMTTPPVLLRYSPPPASPCGGLSTTLASTLVRDQPESSSTGTRLPTAGSPGVASAVRAPPELRLVSQIAGQTKPPG